MREGTGPLSRSAASNGQSIPGTPEPVFACNESMVGIVDPIRQVNQPEPRVGID